jgi:hypothetical protein
MPLIMAKPLLKIGGVLAFLGLILLYLWWSMRIPAPREEDRVTHREGIYSIIKPPTWEVNFNYVATSRYQDSLELRAPTELRSNRIFIGRFLHEPDFEQIRARDRLIGTEFQGQPAEVFTGRTRLEYYWRALFQRGGEWYELVFWMPLEDDVPASGWWPYLQSFQAKDPPPTTPTLGPFEFPGQQ